MNKTKIAITGLVVLAIVAVIYFMTGTATFKRNIKNIRSEVTGGLERTVKIYSINGELLAEHEGFIDVTFDDSGRVLFELNGKRYVYQNAIVEVIEK